MPPPNEKKGGVATAHDKVKHIATVVEALSTDYKTLVPIKEQLGEVEEILHRLRSKYCENTKRNSFK